MSAVCRSTDVRGMPVTKGMINGQIGSVLRDSGCSGVVIRTYLVLPNQYTGETKSCVLVDGTVRTTPVAIVDLDSPFFVGQVEALCMASPVYDVILGNINDARNPAEPNQNWTLKQATHHFASDNTDSQRESKSDRISDKLEISAVQTRSQKLAEGKPLRKLKVPEGLPEIYKNDIKRAQETDPTLNRIRELTKISDEKCTRFGTSRFLIQDDLIYREFHSPKYDHDETILQLIVPQKFRNHVMKLAHESILGGHQGAKKTSDKVLSNFFWPGIHAEILRYCRSCDICQRTITKGRVTKVPLGKMPLIDVPFKRIAIDIVGPIHPKTGSGNRYILTLVDYATRYPEAIALPYIDTPRVAEAMVNVFSRVGVPSEILTDQGSQFTSELIKEISRLLSIRQLTTTPYHPSCNGLVERFNGTLKQMLKRLCADRPSDWDRYLAPLLFAYRETPQVSLGFSPFELIYGRSVRGPMAILKELWNPETKITYQYVPPVLFRTNYYSIEIPHGVTAIILTYQYVLELRERLESTCDLAHQELSKAAENAKHYYDRKTRPRSFKVDDYVLLLLPTDRNKLLLQWKGPFRVLEKIGSVDYRIDLNGKSKTFHANLLKKYLTRSETKTLEISTEPESTQSLLECATASILECEEPLSQSELGIDYVMTDNEDVIALPALKPNETVADIQLVLIWSLSKNAK